MGKAADDLLNHMESRTGYDLPYEEVRHLQVQAINERLQENIDKIKIVTMRAQDCDVSEVRSLEDAVPLLLPHTAYKSYPESFLLGQKWDKLTKWLGTVSATPTSNTDLKDISGVDEWIDRLQEAGHFVSCSSGTTGKSAMLNMTAKDIEFGQKDLVNAVCWGAGINNDQSWRMVSSAPVAQVPKNTAMGLSLFNAFARTDVMPISLQVPPITVGSMTDMVVMRKKITDGSALPEEIAEFENVSAERESVMAKAMDTCVDTLIASKDEKLMFMGYWGGHFSLAKAVRDRGLDGKDFNPENAIFVSGGLKRAQLPDDYREFVYETFNIRPERTFMSYGMQEIQTNMPRCQEGGRYHVPAWLVCLPLNENGDELLPIGDKPITGRAAFFDLSLEGRWGGVISGDCIEVDFSPCACGAKSPSISDNIARYADLSGDDKIGCAGTVDSYVRGIS